MYVLSVGQEACAEPPSAAMPPPDAYGHVQASGTASLTNGFTCTDPLPPDWHGATTSLCRQFVVMFKKRAITSIREPRNFLIELALPVTVVALVLLMLELSYTPAGPSLLLGPTSTFDTPTECPVSRASSATRAAMEEPGLLLIDRNKSDTKAMSQWLLNSAFKHGPSRWGAFTYNSTVQISDSASSTSLRLLNISQGPGGANISTTSMFHNSSSYHAVPAYASHHNQARLRLKIGNPFAYLRVRNHPLPLTAQEQQRFAIILSVIASLFLLVPFCYLTANFAVFVVKERQSKSKHLQLVSGTNPTVYWVAAYAWDLVNYLIIVAAVILVFVLFGNEAFTGTRNTAIATVLVFVLYGASVIPLSYCYTFMFENPASAQIGISLLNFVAGFILTLASYILAQIPETRDLNEFLLPFYEVFPPYCFGNALINLSIQPILNIIAASDTDPLSEEITGKAIRYMAIEAVAYFILVLLLEKRIFQGAAAVIRGTKAYAYVELCVDRVQRAIVCLLCTLITLVLLVSFIAACFDGDVATVVLFLVLLVSVVFCWAQRSGCCTSIGKEAKEHVASEPEVVLEMTTSTVNATQTATSPHSLNSVVPLEGVDEDVAAEAERVASGAADDSVLKVDNIRKVYEPRGNAPEKVAVVGLSIGIAKGECFGLLGINGAGKTTTMSMLTGEVLPSSGNASVNGNDVITDLAKVFLTLPSLPYPPPLWPYSALSLIPCIPSPSIAMSIWGVLAGAYRYRVLPSV